MINRGFHDLLLNLAHGKHRSRSMIRDYQSRQLLRLIHHAYNRVPFYRKLFDQNGLKPSEIQGLDDLHRIPITNKRQLKAVPERDLLAENLDPDGLIQYSTSGATGEPLTVHNSSIEEWIHALFRLRAYRSFGFRIPERMARLRDPGLGCRSLIWKLIQATGLYRIHELRTFPADEVVANLRRVRPDSLAGYPGGVYYVAKMLTEDDRKVIKPRWVAVGGADVLPIMRKEIERGFGTRLYETYACRETAMIAWECRQTRSLHVCDDHLILEVMKDGRPATSGETGEVVVTVLHSFAQPFIRYRIHDSVTKGEDRCSCGAPFSTLQNVEGRTNDRIMFRDGPSRPPGPIFGFIEDDIDWIRQYQLIQERFDLVILKLVLLDQPIQEELEALERVSRQFLGAQVDFRIEYVDELMPEPGKKFRPSLCKILDSEDAMPPT